MCSLVTHRRRSSGFAGDADGRPLPNASVTAGHQLIEDHGLNGATDATGTYLPHRPHAGRGLMAQESDVFPALPRCRLHVELHPLDDSDFGCPDGGVRDLQRRLSGTTAGTTLSYGATILCHWTWHSVTRAEILSPGTHRDASVIKMRRCEPR